MFLIKERNHEICCDESAVHYAHTAIVLCRRSSTPSSSLKTLLHFRPLSLATDAHSHFLVLHYGGAELSELCRGRSLGRATDTRAHLSLQSNDSHLLVPSSMIASAPFSSPQPSTIGSPPCHCPSSTELLLILVFRNTSSTQIPIPVPPPNSIHPQIILTIP